MRPRPQPCPDVDKIVVSKVAAAQLCQAARLIDLPKAWAFEIWPECLAYRPAHQLREICDLVEQVRHALSAHGFATISLADIVEGATEAAGAAAVTLLLTAFGDLMKVFETIPSHWRVIDVDITRSANRSRGVGRQSLHLDFVNASDPPDYIALYCKRADPLGGGASLVANFDDIGVSLSRTDLATLRLPIFSDGEVKNLSGVGVDINPFRVYAPTEKFVFRYTANLIDNAQSPAALKALLALNRHLDERAYSIILNAGDILLVDQRRAVHGRLPLGVGQEELDPVRRRLVLHSFLRRRSECVN